MTTTTKPYMKRRSRSIRRSTEGIAWRRVGMTKDGEFYAIRVTRSSMIQFLNKKTYDSIEQYPYEIPTYSTEDEVVFDDLVELNSTKALRFVAITGGEIQYEYAFDYLVPTDDGVELFRKGEHRPYIRVLGIEYYVDGASEQTCESWRIEKNPYFK